MSMEGNHMKHIPYPCHYSFMEEMIYQGRLRGRGGERSPPLSQIVGNFTLLFSHKFNPKNVQFRVILSEIYKLMILEVKTITLHFVPNKAGAYTILKVKK